MSSQGSYYQSVLSKFPTKKKLYRAMVFGMGLYLPEYHQCTLKHMQNLASRKASALKTEDVASVPVPNFPELSVDKLYLVFKTDSEVMKYLPQEKKKAPKTFVWRVISTLRPDWTQKVLDDALSKRQNDLLVGPVTKNRFEFDTSFLEALDKVVKEGEVNQHAKKNRMTVHVDISKRKIASKKRRYEVAFTAEDDPLFKKPFVKAKRIKRSLGNESMRSESDDDEHHSKKANSERAGHKQILALDGAGHAAAAGSATKVKNPLAGGFNGHPNQLKK